MNQRFDSVVRIESAHAAIAFFIVGDPGFEKLGNLFAQFEEFLVPIGMDFVDIHPGIVVEGKFQRAGLAFVFAVFGETDFKSARFLPGKFAGLHFLKFFVDFRVLEFAGGQKDQLNVHLLGGIEEHPVIGETLAIPTNQRQAFQSARVTSENRKRRSIQVRDYFLFESIEIDVHTNTTIRTGAGRWGYIGGRERFATLFDGTLRN